MIPIMF